MHRRIAAVLIAGGYGQINGECKLLAMLNGQPMICHALNPLLAANPEIVIVVVNPMFGDLLQDTLNNQYPGLNLRYCVQASRSGTAGALACAIEELDKAGNGIPHLVTNFGDMPCWAKSTIQMLTARHFAPDRPVATIVSIPLVPGTRPERYGRILRNKEGRITGTIEPWQIKPGQEIQASRVNPSLYCFQLPWVRRVLPTLPPINKGDGFAAERMLQDTIRAAETQNKPVAEIQVDDLNQALGVNTPGELEAVRMQFV